MSHQVISATTLARNFSEFLNRVRYQGVTLDVTRGSDVIACISPPSPAGGYPIAKLDSLFASPGPGRAFPLARRDRLWAPLPRLSADEAAAFESDVTAVVGKLQPEGDPWAS